MFEGLNWRTAFKRAAIFTVIWLGLVYVLNTAFPGSFGVGGRQQLYALAINAVLFFFLYALLFAFFERRRSRRTNESHKKAEENGEVREAGPLKGTRNPNTSRRKTRRRTRR